MTKLSLLVKFNRTTGGRFAGLVQAARQVPGVEWEFDPREVSCDYKTSATDLTCLESLPRGSQLTSNNPNHSWRTLCQ